jgi:hypothetical protein
MRLAWTGHRTGLGLALAVTAALLASCHRPVSKEAAAVPTPIGVERPGPVSWDATAGGFTLNGKPLKTTKLWTFDGSTEGFTTVGSTILPAPGQGAAVTITDPTIRSPKGLNIPGGQYNLVLVRLTRVSPGAIWDGALYYSTPVHREAVAYFGKPLSGADPKVGETTILVYDMAHQANGAPDWMQSSIDQIRLDLEDKPGGSFVIRQIAIAENPNPTTAPGAAAPAAKAPPPPPAAKS